jgi:6-phosphogluconolactonase (cycloisomerase 2 family)
VGSFYRKIDLSGNVRYAGVVGGGGLPGAGRAAATGPARARFAYVGCYTTKKRKGHGEGIGIYRIDPGTGDWMPAQLVKDLVNPSFLALDRQGRTLYAVHGDTSQATAFAIDPQSGRLTLLNQQTTGGKNPVHLAVDPTNRFLAVANYSTGNVAVLPINPDGSLAPPSDLVPLAGEPGPHPVEQTASHPHHIPFDRLRRFLVVPDKGLDKIFAFRLDTGRGKLLAADPPYVMARAGAGPRHVDFHPRLPYAYVINELDSTITTYRSEPDRGAFTPLQVVPTLPPGFSGKSTTAEIAVAPSGRFVYGSNRGHGSLAIFAIDQTSGVLAPLGWEPTQGLTPRFFGLDPSGAVLYAANQGSDTIVTFLSDEFTGRLTPTGQVVKTGSPSTIVFR